MPKLTIRTIENTKPGISDVFIWDDELRGFGVRIKPSNRRSFIVQYRNQYGATKRMTLGNVRVLKPEEARRMARELLADVAAGHDPSQVRHDRRTAPTVKELADRYLAEHAQVKKKPRSVYMDVSYLSNYVLPAIGHLPVEAVTRDHIAKLHHGMRATPTSANRALALISKMFTLAEVWGLRTDGTSPCRHVGKYPERKLERFLNPGEIRRLGATLNELERVQAVRASAILAVRLLLMTGCRCGEILNLRWDHVDFEGGMLRLPDSKTGAKVVYIGKETAALLLKQRALIDSPWVIPGKDGRKQLVNIRKPWMRICEAAGLENVRIHDLRHTYASCCINNGMPLEVIGSLLGHSQITTTQRYAHLADAPQRRANSIIDGELATLLSGHDGSNLVHMRTHAKDMKEIKSG